MVGNTLFWLGLGYIVFSGLVPLIVVGSVLALFLGGLLIFFSFRVRTYEVVNPKIARPLVLSTGILALVGGLAGIIWFQSNDTPVSGIVNGRIERALQQGSKQLDLSGLQLTHLPPKTWKLIDLTSLDLSGNHLTRLPPEIGQLSNLEYLDLSENKLAELPLEIGRLTHLIVLDLSGNRLTRLPPEIGKLSRLEHLYLARNRLTDLPPEIGQLGNLTSLNLFNNQLTRLPAEIGQLSNLKSLSLNYNQLTGLPGEIEQLSHLQTLRLEGNRISDLPPGVAQWVSSQGLNVQYDRGQRLLQLNYDFICSAIAILMVALAWIIDRGLGKYEAALRQKNMQIGQVFSIPPFGRKLFILVLLLAGMVTLILFTSALNAERTHVSLQAGIGVPLLLVPLMLFCLYMIVHNSGVVVLTQEAVLLRCLGHSQCLPYQEITGIKEWSPGLMPNLVLEGRNSTLKIPRSIENWPLLYSIIQQRLALQQQTPVFPYTLRVTSTAFWFSVIGTGLLVIFYLGLGLSGFWLPRLQGGTFSSVAFMIIFVLASFLFIPAIVIFVLGSLKRKQPWELVLTADAIRFRYPGGQWFAWSTGELSRVVLRPEAVITSRWLGIKTEYVLELEWRDHRRLLIDQDRARQFGFSPERLYGLFSQLYRPENGGRR